MTKNLNVLVLVDLPAPSKSERFEEMLTGSDWNTEINVVDALRALKHKVEVVGLFNTIEPLLKRVAEKRPDIVFNLAEHFDNRTEYERNLVGLIELLGLPYTGTGPTGLMLCKNKSLMKKIMSYHHIRSPHFDVISQSNKIFKPAELKYPLIVKPIKEDASYGISQASFVDTDEGLIERVKFVHESMNQKALIEEYVEGRELYVGIVGNERLAVYSPRELVFGEIPQDEPKIATFKAKWDAGYREKWGIKNRFTNPIAEGVLEKIVKVSRRVYRFLHIKGYGRIDLRLTAQNEIMILEANPNPAITADDDLALAAEKDGMSYNELIQKILQLGLRAHHKI